MGIPFYLLIYVYAIISINPRQSMQYLSDFSCRSLFYSLCLGEQHNTDYYQWLICG